MQALKKQTKKQYNGYFHHHDGLVAIHWPLCETIENFKSQPHVIIISLIYLSKHLRTVECKKTSN